jgi:hypothetical protein
VSSPPHHGRARKASRRRSEASRKSEITVAKKLAAWKIPSETSPAAGVDLS